LTIVDDGKGFEPNQVPSNRLGLEIMRERAGSIEASFDVESLPEHGTTIRVIYRNNTAK
jgi:signal transduction histidine kinase